MGIPKLKQNPWTRAQAIWFLVQVLLLNLPTTFPPHLISASASFIREGNSTHSSTLDWKIPWMEEPGRLQSMRSLSVGHDWATSLSLFPFMHWRRKWQPTPVFLPRESQGRGSLVGGRLWGCTVRHDWSNLAAAASFIALFSELWFPVWFWWHRSTFLADKHFGGCGRVK